MRSPVTMDMATAVPGKQDRQTGGQAVLPTLSGPSSWSGVTSDLIRPVDAFLAASPLVVDGRRLTFGGRSYVEAESARQDASS